MWVHIVCVGGGGGGGGEKERRFLIQCKVDT